MPKRAIKAAVDLDKDIKVGEGDDAISDWYHGFDVIDEIKTCLWDGPELEWAKIADELTAYPEFADRLDGLEGGQDLLKLFEEFPGASVAHSFYDHGSPGCSGFYIEAFVTRKHLEYAQKTFSDLLSAITLFSPDSYTVNSLHVLSIAIVGTLSKGTRIRLTAK